MTAKGKSAAWIFTGDRGRYCYDHARIETDSTPGQFLHTLAIQLARIPRYLGATLAAWPVGAHAIAVSKLVESLGGSARDALRGLHHDDHEMLTQDLPGPLRRWIKDAIKAGHLTPAADWYEHACGEAQAEIERHLGLTMDPDVTDDGGAALVKRCDALVLEAERRLLHYEGPLSDWGVPGLSDAEVSAAIVAVRGAMVIALTVPCRDAIHGIMLDEAKRREGNGPFSFDTADPALLDGPCVHEIAATFVFRDQHLRERAGLAPLV